MWIFEPLYAALSLQKIVCLFFFSIAKYRNIVKWYCGS